MVPHGGAAMASANRQQWGVLLVLALSGLSWAVLQQPWRWGDVAALSSAFAVPRKKIRGDSPREARFKRTPDYRKGSPISPKNEQLLTEEKTVMYDPDTQQENTANMLQEKRMDNTKEVPRQKFHDDRQARFKPRGPTIRTENRKLLTEVRHGMCDPDKLRNITSFMLNQRSSTRLRSTKEHLVLSQQLFRNGQWEETLALLANWQEQNPDEKLHMQLFHQALAAMGKGQQWEKAVQILADMKKISHLDPDSYNIVMITCLEANEWRSALTLFDGMFRWYQNYPSFSHAVGACAQGREWRRGLDLIREVVHDDGEDMRPDWRMFISGIVMAGDSGRWEAALHFLDEMWEWEVVPDEVTYDTVIRACQRCQRWEEALHVFRQMRRKGFRPEEPTYAAVAASCRKSGQDQLAESVEREARILLS